MNDTKYREWLATRTQQANAIKAFRNHVGVLLEHELGAWVASRSDEDPLVGKPSFSVTGTAAAEKIAPDFEPKIEVTSSEDDTLSFIFSPVLPQMTVHGASLKLTTGEDLSANPVISADTLENDLSLRMKHAPGEPDAEVSLSAILSAFEETVFRK